MNCSRETCPTEPKIIKINIIHVKHVSRDQNQNKPKIQRKIEKYYKDKDTNASRDCDFKHAIFSDISSRTPARSDEKDIYLFVKCLFY